MKIKLKPLLITGGVTLAATIALAIGLSFIPLGDKKIEHSSKEIDPITKDDNLVPGLPDNNKSDPIKPDDSINLPNREHSKNIIAQEQGVKYVAIGDSITAGFDSTLALDRPGSYIKGQSISGISFPVYLASFIQQIQEDKLLEFNNYGSSGSTLEDWYNLLNYSQMEKTLSIKDKERLISLFDPKNKDLNTVSNQIKHQLKNSNLVTITLGANDALNLLAQNINKIPLLNIITEAKQKNINYAEIATLITNSLTEIFKNLDKKMQKFNEFLLTILKDNESKELKANVNYVSYPLLMPHIFKILESALPADAKVNIGSIFINLINKKIEYKATSFNQTNKQENFYYINGYDEEYWSKHLFELVPNMFEIHPSTFGYKRMAQDLFVKLVLPSRNQKILNDNHIPWSQKFIQSDQATFLLQMDVKDPLEVINHVFNNSFNDYTLVKDDIYTNYDFERKNKEENYRRRILENKEIYDSVLSKLFTGILNSEIFKKIDANGSLKNLLTKNNNKNLNSVINWFYKSKYFSDSLLDTQKEYIKQIGTAQNHNFEVFKKILNDNFTNERKIVNLLTSFLKLDFLKAEKQEVTSALTSVFSNTIKLLADDKQINYLVKFVGKEKVEKIISIPDLSYALKFIANNEKFKKGITDLYTSIIDNVFSYKTVKTYDELVKEIINKKQTKDLIINIIKNVFNDITKDTEMRRIIASVIKNKLNTTPWLLTGIDDPNDVTKLINKLLNSFDDFEKEFNLIRTFLDKIINEMVTKPFTKIDIKSAFNNTFNEFKQKYLDVNINSTIIKIVQIINNADLSENSETIQKLILNTIVYLKNNNKLPEKITDKLFEKWADISKYVEKNKLTGLINDTFSSAEFSAFLNGFINYVVNLKPKTFDNVTDIKSLLKEILINYPKSNSFNKINPLIKFFLKNNTVVEIFEKIEPRLSFIFKNKDTTSEFIDLISENENFKAILSNFLEKGLFNDSVVFDKNLNINIILKTWFSDKDNNKIIIEKLTNFILDLTKNQTFKQNISKILIYKIKEKPEFLKDVNEENLTKFFEELAGTINNFEQEYHLIKNALETLISNIAADGIQKGKEKELLKLVLNNLLNSFKGKNLDEVAYNIFKELFRIPNFNLYKKDVYKLISNTYKYLISKESFIDFIVKKINKPLENYANNEELKTIVKDILSSNSTKILFDNFIEILGQIDLNSLNGHTRLSDVLFELSKTNLTLSNNLLNFINESLSIQSVKDLLNKIWNDTTNEHFKLLTIDDWISLVNTLSTNNNFKNIFNKFVIEILLQGKFKNFKDKFTYEALSKSIFKDATDNKDLSKNINELLKSLSNNEVFAALIAKITYKALNDESDVLVKNITEANWSEFIKELLQTYDGINSILNTDTIFEAIFNYIKDNGKDTKKADLFKTIVDKVKANLAADSLDASLIKLIQKINANSLLTNKKDLIRQLFTNVIEYLTSDGSKLATLIVNAIYKEDGFLGKKATYAEFVNIINECLKVPNFKKILDKILINLMNKTKADIEGYTSFKQYINAAFTEYINSAEFDNDFTDLLKSILEVEKVNDLLVAIVNDYINIDKENLKRILKEVIELDSFKKLAKNILLNIFSGSIKLDDFKNSNSFIKAWFKINLNNQEFKDSIYEFITSLLSNENISSLLAEIIHKHYDTYFTNIELNEFKEFFKKLGKKLSSFISIIDPNKVIINKAIDYIIENGTNIDKKAFKETIINALKENYKTNNTSVENILLNIIKKLDEEDFISSNKDLIKKLIVNVITYLADRKDNNLTKWIVNALYKNETIKKVSTKEELNEIINNILALPSFKTSIEAIVDSILSLDKTTLTNATDIKALIDATFESINNTNNFGKIYSFIKDVINNDAIVELLAKILNEKISPNSTLFTKTNVRDLAQVLIDNSDFKELIKDFLKNAIFNNTAAFNDLNNIDTILKNWLKTPAVQNSLVDKLNNIIKIVLDNTNSRKIIAGIICRKIKIDESDLFKGISEQDLINVLSNILYSYNDLDEVLGIKENIIKSIVENIATNGTKFDNQTFIEKIKHHFEKLFNSNNWEKNFIKLFKIVIKNANLRADKDLIIQLIKNVFNVVKTKYNLGEKTFNEIPNKLKQIKDILNADDFNNLYEAIINGESSLFTIVELIVSDISLNSSKYETVNSLLDIFKVFFGDSKNVDSLSKNLQPFINFILKDTTVIKLLKGLWKTNTEPYGINAEDAANTAFINSLIDELPSLIEKLKLLPKFAKGIAEALKSATDLNDFTAKLGKAILNQIDFLDYSMVKILLSSQTARTHHQTLKQDVLKIINGITSNDDMIDKFINDFNLMSKMSELELSDAEAKIFWQQLFKSLEIKNILTLILDEILDNTQKYAALNSWVEMIKTIFTDPNNKYISKIKTNTKAWYKKAVVNSPSVFKTLGNIMANSLIKNGYSITRDQYPILQNFMLSLAQAIPATDILDNIIDSIFNELKKISTTKPDELKQTFTEAVLKGAFSFITNPSTGKISLSKIFENTPKFKIILSKLSNKTYSDFINLIFSSAPKTDKKGIYNVMFNSAGSNDKIEIGSSGIWDILKGKLNELITTFVVPLYENYFKQLEDDSRVFASLEEIRKNISGYSSIWRIYTFFNTLIFGNTNPWVYWNLAAPTINKAFISAYSEAIKKHSNLKNKYQNNLQIIGLQNNDEPLYDYLAGMNKYENISSTSSRIRKNKYGNDNVWAYIYYQKERDILYNPTLTMKEVLIEGMHKGYLPFK